MTGEPCALCSAPSRESALVFTHVREGTRVSLEAALCGDCGDRMEKHLKRVVPKRLMHFSTLARLVPRSFARARPWSRVAKVA